MLAEKYPDKFILNGSFDPRLGEHGLKDFEELANRYDLKGIKLYTAEWHGESKGWKLKDDWAKRYLEKCQELGVTNIHVHKGPTIRPLNKDAFDVADVDQVASEFTDLNFIVEHVGLPRLEDFCWIGVQEPNVYGGLAVAMPFIHSRPRYFAQIIGELLYWLDEDRILFASDYAIWQPKWLVEMFVDFQIPEDMQSEYGTLTPEIKRKILGLNAANLYDIEVPSEIPQPKSRSWPGAEADYPEATTGDAHRGRGPGRPLGRPGPRARRTHNGPEVRLGPAGSGGCGGRPAPAADAFLRPELRLPDGRGRQRGGCSRSPACARRRVFLDDHYAAEEINAGMAEGRASRAPSPARRPRARPGRSARYLPAQGASSPGRRQLCRMLLADGYAPRSLRGMRLEDVPSSEASEKYLEPQGGARARRLRGGAVRGGPRRQAGFPRRRSSSTCGSPG